VKKPRKWRVESEDKVLVVWAKPANGKRHLRVSVENDDVTEDERKQVNALADDIARLPRLLRIEAIVKEMFDEGSLDPYPTSDESNEYHLREWTGWKPKR